MEVVISFLPTGIIAYDNLIFNIPKLIEILSSSCGVEYSGQRLFTFLSWILSRILGTPVFTCFLDGAYTGSNPTLSVCDYARKQLLLYVGFFYGCSLIRRSYRFAFRYPALMASCSVWKMTRCFESSISS